jgi:pimeloyl-ACP methyl ester carboxylesterase
VRDWGERDPRWAGIRSETMAIPARGPGDARVPTEVHMLRAGAHGGREPVLLVHGLGGNATNWLDVMGALAETGPVVAVDLPGFGRTAPPDPRAARLRPQVRFLHRLLEALGWEHAVVHGNSLGGLLAVLLAADVPDRVSRLVLTSPALPPPRSPAALSPAAAARFVPFVSWRLGGMMLDRVYARTPAERIRRETMDLVLGDLDDLRPAMREVQLENVELGKHAPWRAPAFARAAGDMVATLGVARSVHRAIDAVRSPTLVVWGELDQLVGRATMDAVLARRPDWSRVDLARVGHVAMLEAPDRWLAVVRAAEPAPTP